MTTTEAVRPTRRSNVERTATTRRRVIDAAIACLYARGYTATTTSMIAEGAGVSRGALLHHVPTKVDLVLALVEDVVARQRAYYTEALRTYPRGRDRFIAMTELTWRMWSEPQGVAVTEIMVAARSDRLLGDRLPGVFAEIQATQADAMARLAQAAGIDDHESVARFSRLSAAAIRGLAIELMFNRDSRSVEGAVELLHDLKVSFTDTLLAAAHKKPSAPGDAEGR